MDKFTIYCTAEQTKNALELGAPIKINNYPPINGEEFIWLSPPADAIAWNNSTNCTVPTAEQMVEWLEDQEEISNLHIFRLSIHWTFDLHTSNGEEKNNRPLFNTRKEATLAAISSALEYLTNNKK